MTTAQSPPAYWDPGNLLQVTEEGRGGVVQCVGTTKLYGVRCRYTTNDGAVIYQALAELAARRPADISRVDLRRLAVTCLCAEHNRRAQPDAVADRWAAVVRRAARNHDALIQAEMHHLHMNGNGTVQPALPSTTNSQQERIDQLERELAAAQGKVSDWETLSKERDMAVRRWGDTQKSYVKLQAALGAAQDGNVALLHEIAHAEEKERERESERARRAADAEAKIAALETDRTALETRLAAAEDETAELRNQLEEAREAFHRATEESAMHKAKVAALEAAKAAAEEDLRRIEREKEDVAAGQRRAEADAATAREEIARLTAVNERLHLDHAAAVAKLGGDMEETTEDFKRQIQTIKTEHAAETHALHAQHAAVREELDAAREELATVRAGADAAAEEARQLVEARERALEKCRVELGEASDRVDVAERQVAMCRLHGLGTWFGRHSRKHRKGKDGQALGRSVETVEAEHGVEDGGVAVSST